MIYSRKIPFLYNWVDYYMYINTHIDFNQSKISLLTYHLRIRNMETKSSSLSYKTNDYILTYYIICCFLTIENKIKSRKSFRYIFIFQRVY